MAGANGNLRCISKLTIVSGVDHPPAGYRTIARTPLGYSANLCKGMGSWRRSFLCVAYGNDRPITDIIVVSLDENEKCPPGYYMITHTPSGKSANLHWGLGNRKTYLAYTTSSAHRPICGLAVIVWSKGEAPPPDFCCINRNINNSLSPHKVFICFSRGSYGPPRTMNMSEDLSDTLGPLDRRRMSGWTVQTEGEYENIISESTDSPSHTDIMRRVSSSTAERLSNSSPSPPGTPSTPSARSPAISVSNPRHSLLPSFASAVSMIDDSFCFSARTGDMALPTYAEVESGEPTVEYFRARGNEAFAVHDYPRAYDLYSRAIELDEENSVILSNRSACLLELGDTENAMKDAEEVVRLKPEWFKGYLRIALCYERMGRYEDAIKAYEEAVQRHPGDSFDLKDMIFNVQRLMAEEVKRKGNDAFQKGDYEEAVRLYSEAIELDSCNQVYFTNRAAAYIKLGLFAKALDDAEAVVESTPEWIKGHLRKAEALCGLERYGEALKTCMISRKEVREGSRVILSLDQAIRSLVDKVIVAERQNLSRPSVEAGAVLCRLNEVFEHSSDLPGLHVFHLHVLRAHCYVCLSRHEDVVTETTNALSMRPDWLQGYIWKSRSLAALGRSKEAKAALKTGIKQSKRQISANEPQVSASITAWAANHLSGRRASSQSTGSSGGTSNPPSVSNLELPNLNLFRRSSNASRSSGQRERSSIGPENETNDSHLDVNALRRNSDASAYLSANMRTVSLGRNEGTLNLGRSAQTAAQRSASLGAESSRNLIQIDVGLDIPRLDNSGRDWTYLDPAAAKDVLEASLKAKTYKSADTRAK
eukprot:comp19887_c1_seq1/m.24073 comp19887_c1_seq1/g.24073  ORF comp19887_c1_seq1/g.24073 comp19887_c1_seq1/m.24073 type:complete len:819 (-) comp19887_c1_seq1:85-2541(-)